MSVLVFGKTGACRPGLSKCALLCWNSEWHNRRRTVPQHPGEEAVGRRMGVPRKRQVSSCEWTGDSRSCVVIQAYLTDCKATPADGVFSCSVLSLGFVPQLLYHRRLVLALPGSWCPFLLLGALLFDTRRGRGTKKGRALCFFLKRDESEEQSAYLCPVSIFEPFNILNDLVWGKLGCKVFWCFPKGAKSAAEEGIQPGSAAVYPIAAPFSIPCTCHSLVSLTIAFSLVAVSEDEERRKHLEYEG